jgi:hypothetical protein
MALEISAIIKLTTIMNPEITTNNAARRNQAHARTAMTSRAMPNYRASNTVKKIAFIRIKEIKFWMALRI